MNQVDERMDNNNYPRLIIIKRGNKSNKSPVCKQKVTICYQK